MIRLLSVVGVVAALVLVAASAFMNFQYVTGWGKNEINGQILGAVSVAFDILKALLPFFILWAFKNRRLLHVLVGSVLFVGLAGFSLLSALGFAASNRDHATGSRQDLTAQYEEIKTDLSAKRGQLDKQPQARAVSVVEQALNAKRQHKRFSSSVSCTDATASKSRTFCTELFNLQTELAAAKIRAALSGEITTLKAKRNALRGQGATMQADPQAGLVAKLTGLKIEDTQTALVVFISVLVELAAAFGLYLATAHGGMVKKPASGRSETKTKSVPKLAIVPEIADRKKQLAAMLA